MRQETIISYTYFVSKINCDESKMSIRADAFGNEGGAPVSSSSSPQPLAAGPKVSGGVAEALGGVGLKLPITASYVQAGRLHEEPFEQGCELAPLR